MNKCNNKRRDNNRRNGTHESQFCDADEYEQDFNDDKSHYNPKYTPKIPVSYIIHYKPPMNKTKVKEKKKKKRS